MYLLEFENLETRNFETELLQFPAGVVQLASWAFVPKSPNGQMPSAFSDLSCFCSTSIFAVFSAGHGLARRSGRSAIQNAVKPIIVASRVRISGFTLSSVSTAEWCV